MPTCASSADGTRIAYENRGSGLPALVLVHGWACNRRHWDHQLDALSDRRLVVGIDLAGHGESAATRTEWSIAAFGKDVASVVDALGLADVVLVGHSMGADVVVQAARGLAGRVRGMVWVDEFRQLDHFRDEQQVRDRMLPFRADFANAADAFIRGMFPPTADAALVDRVAASIRSASPDVALPCLEATWHHARLVPALLSELRLPVIAINCEAAHTDVASMRRHGVDVMVMPGVGHFPMLERPAAFNACLAQALDRLR